MLRYCMIVRCGYCKKEFKIKPYMVLKSEFNYCSTKCYGLHKKKLCKGKNNNFYGKKHTQETKDKISAANLGRKHNGAWNSGLSNYKKGRHDRVTINGKRMLLSHHIWLKNNPKREIPKSHVIHHIDLDPYNNDISNLEIMESIKHKKLHVKIMKEFINKK